MSQVDGERGRVATRSVVPTPRSGVVPVRARGPEEYAAAAPAPERDRLGASAAVAVIAVLALLVGAAWWGTHHQAVGRIDHGTTVDGVAIGGERPAVAVTTLREGLGQRAGAPIALEVAGRTVHVDPAAAGLSVDYRATVEHAATGDSWQPSALWSFYTDGTSLPPVVHVDETALRAELARLVRRLGVAPRSATLSFRGGVVHVVHAHDGQGLDVSQVAAALRGAYLSDTPAHVDLTAVPPTVGDRAVQAALDQFVNRAVASPVTLVLGGHREVLSPHRFVSALRLVDDGSRLRLSADPAALMQLISPLTDRLGTPRPATVVIDHGHPRVVAGRAGLQFSRHDVLSTFLDLIYRRPPHRLEAVPARRVEPSFTPDAARRLSIETPVAVATVHGGAVSASTLQRQAAALDGTVLRPGRTLSLAQLVPPSTSGDLTELASALYAASFRAGLAEVERRAPAIHVAGAPVGLEAIVLPGGPDLRFRDDTPYGVLVGAHVTGGAIEVTLWSTPHWTVSTTTTCSPLDAGVSRVSVTRRLTDVGRSTVAGEQVADTDYHDLPAGLCHARR